MHSWREKYFFTHYSNENTSCMQEINGVKSREESSLEVEGGDILGHNFVISCEKFCGQGDSTM